MICSFSALAIAMFYISPGSLFDVSISWGGGYIADILLRFAYRSKDRVSVPLDMSHIVARQGEFEMMILASCMSLLQLEDSTGAHGFFCMWYVNINCIRILYSSGESEKEVTRHQPYRRRAVYDLVNAIQVLTVIR